MSKQNLFYKSAVPVAMSRHRDLSIDAGEGMEFAADVNAVPIVVSEFESIHREYPIVFVPVGESVQPLACVGLRDDENLFVSDSGKWLGTYIPAFVRRYPFVFSKIGEEDKYALCIDESFEGCNRDGKGKALFIGDEGSDYLKEMFDFTKHYQESAARTQNFCRKLGELQLLDRVQVSFQLPSGDRAALNGMLTVDREKLKSLSDELLGELLRSGGLEMIYAHLHSLGNFERLRELTSTKIASTASA